MNEFKFRAYQKRYKEWLDPSRFALIGDGSFMQLTQGWIPFNPDPDIAIMRFTGLRDVNGKGIYEGDVVRFRSHPDKAVECKVTYDENSARFMAEMLDGRGWHSFQHFNLLEIIGNQFDNPELLK